MLKQLYTLYSYELGFIINEDEHSTSDWFLYWYSEGKFTLSVGMFLLV